jgi:hypothetical protein
MSESRTRPPSTPPWAVAEETTEEETTGWVGFLVFGGLMLMLAGAFHATAGLVALFRDGYYLVPSQDLLVTVDYSAWGWAHLLVGAAGVVIGYGVVSGRPWARGSGVVIAGLSAIVSLAFLAAHPAWSLTIITLDVLIIYALVVHGREAEIT